MEMHSNLKVWLKENYAQLGELNSNDLDKLLGSVRRILTRFASQISAALFCGARARIALSGKMPGTADVPEIRSNFRAWLKEWEYHPVGKYAQLGELNNNDLDELTRGNLRYIWT